MSDGWIRRALKRLSNGNPNFYVAASGSPREFINPKENGYNNIRLFSCIDCYGTIQVEGEKDEVECPHCHGILPIGLLAKLAMYDLDKKRKNS